MKLRKNRTFSERLYKMNKLAGANQSKIDLYDVVYQKLEDPPFEPNEEKDS